MTKLQFLLALNDRLSCLPRNEAEERLNFYSEMIEDRMEEGLSEADAVAAVGSVDEIANQIISDTPLTKIVKVNLKPQRKVKAWEIVLLALGSPVWFSLLIAAFAVLLALYVSFWAVIISLWAVFGAVVGCGICGIVAGIGCVMIGSGPTGMALISAGVVCIGLSILLFYGCKTITKASLLLVKKIALWIKNRFIKKEEA